jgi:hypothetical protein
MTCFEGLMGVDAPSMCLEHSSSHPIQDGHFRSARKTCVLRSLGQ